MSHRSQATSSAPVCVAVSNRRHPPRCAADPTTAPEQVSDRPRDRAQRRAQAEPEAADRLDRRRLCRCGSFGSRSFRARPLRAPAPPRAASPGTRRTGVTSWDATSGTIPRPYCATAPTRVRSVTMSTSVPPSTGRQVRFDLRLRAPPAARLVRSRLEHGAALGLVGVDPLHLGVERQRDRPELDADLRLPGRAVDRLGQLGARHAGDHARDVHEQVPRLLWRCGDPERVLDPQGRTPR